MKLSGVSEKVFLDRYSLKDKAGKPVEKKPDEMWKRIAKAVAKVEDKKLQKKLVEGARKLDNTFDWKNVGDNTLRIYREILK